MLVLANSFLSLKAKIYAMKASDILKDYPSFDDLQSKSVALESILKNAIQYKTEEHLKTIFSLIDLTSLDVTDTTKKVADMCKKVNSFNESYPDMANVASICIYPALVDTVKHELMAKRVGITSVIGGFPASQTYIEVKELETEIAVLEGATEVDIVMSVGKFLEGKYKKVAREINDISKVLSKAHLKVILETGALSNDQVFLASLLAIRAKADFIKTSTGKFSPAATPMAVYTMCLAIKAQYMQSGKMIGIKPAGGIATAEDALAYYAIVKEVLGDEWLDARYFRIGASRLANNLLEDIALIEGKEFAPHF